MGGHTLWVAIECMKDKYLFHSNDRGCHNRDTVKTFISFSYFSIPGLSRSFAFVVSIYRLNDERFHHFA